MKPYITKHDGFRLCISPHALKRLADRTDLSWGARRKIFRDVASACMFWYRGEKKYDRISIDEQGIRWVIQYTGNNRGTVVTVMPEHWVEEDYSMSEWLSPQD